MLVGLEWWNCQHSLRSEVVLLSSALDSGLTILFVCVCVFQLQIPSVKGFDFAKQHLGQHNKDDILIIHEPAPLPGPLKDHTTPSENGDVPSPKSKIPSKNVRHRGRLLLGFLYYSLWQSMLLLSGCEFLMPQGLMVSAALHVSAARETDDLPKVTHEPNSVSKPLSRAVREGYVISFPTRLKIMNHYL